MATTNLRQLKADLKAVHWRHGFGAVGPTPPSTQNEATHTAAEGAARLGGGEGYLDWLRGGLRRAIAVVSARSGRGGGGGGGAAPVSLNKECVAWAKLGYCHAGPNQVYMKQTCVAECDEGGRAGTIPEPGSLYQAPQYECDRLASSGGCKSSAEYMGKHCQGACERVTEVMPPSDFLSQLGALLLACGFGAAVFYGVRWTVAMDASRSSAARRKLDMCTSQDSAALAVGKGQAKGRTKSLSYSERMQARRLEKERRLRAQRLQEERQRQPRRRRRPGRS